MGISDTPADPMNRARYEHGFFLHVTCERTERKANTFVRHLVGHLEWVIENPELISSYLVSNRSNDP